MLCHPELHPGLTYALRNVKSPFFNTTADSASTVMGTMSQRGRVNPTPWVAGVWGLMTTIIAVAMLLSGGTDSLSSLQTIIIVAGSPFLLVVIALLVSLIRGVAEDPSRLDEKAARTVHLRMLREQRAGEKAVQKVRKRADKEARRRGRKQSPGEAVSR